MDITPPKIDLLLQNPDTIIGQPSPKAAPGAAAIAISGGIITHIAPLGQIAAQADLTQARIIDCTGKTLAPGFVDCHTHVVFGGSRVREYVLKLTHTPDHVRSQINPTGIVASMQMTRAASQAELEASATARLRAMLAHGTTTAESKSGYGLNLTSELKMLRVNQRLRANPALPDIRSTFLGAHAFPGDVAPDTYVEQIIHEMIPAIVEQSLAEFCDVYIDEGYFDLGQTRRILFAARAAGLKLKIHADQYSALGGSELAAELGVVSADHLNYTPPATMRQLAQAGVVGALMPLIDFAVQHRQPPNARAMLDAGMTIALATDICPGGWTESMQLVMQFACRQYALTPEEALRAATEGAARALDLSDRGILAPGYRADIQIWDRSLEDVIYRLGSNAVVGVIVGGKEIL